VQHIDEVNILRRRAYAFLRIAETSFNNGDYDLTVFLCEQAVQLYLKSLLLEEIGDYPRTCSITRLLQLFQKLKGLEDLYKLYQERRYEFTVLEDSYIASRYLPKEYSREEAEKILNLAREVLKYRILH